MQDYSPHNQRQSNTTGRSPVLQLQCIRILTQTKVHLCHWPGVQILLPIKGLAESISFALNLSWAPLNTWEPKFYWKVSYTAAGWIIPSLHMCCSWIRIRWGKAGELLRKRVSAQNSVRRSSAEQKSAGKESSVGMTEKWVESSLHLRMLRAVDAVTLHHRVGGKQEGTGKKSFVLSAEIPIKLVCRQIW